MFQVEEGQKGSRQRT